MARFFVTILATAAIMLQGVSAYPFYPLTNGTVPYPTPTASGSPLPTGTGVPYPTGTGAPLPTGTGSVVTPLAFHNRDVVQPRKLREGRINLPRP
jgi:hypothetical protein